MKVRYFAILLVLILNLIALAAQAQFNLLEQLDSPIVLQGDDSTAYRDPAALYHDSTFYLFFTVVETEPDGRLFW